MAINSWDAFISHASEDKDDFVRPLVKALNSRGLKIWYDDDNLKVGDSLQDSISTGISKSKFGILILSESFFSKIWPKAELKAIFSNELLEKIKILPIWKDLSLPQIYEYAPFLADKLSLTTDSDIEEIADKLVEVINPEFETKKNFAQNIIRKFFYLKGKELDHKCREVSVRFSKLVKLNNKVAAITFPPNLNEEQEDQYYSDFISEVKNELKIPENIYSEFVTKIDTRTKNEIIKELEMWALGQLSSEESMSLLLSIDEFLDFDVYYVFYGIARMPIDTSEYDKLLESIKVIGSRNK